MIMAVVGPDGYCIVSFKAFLSKDFEITDLGKLKHMLGVLVMRDHPNHHIYLSQTSYIQRTIARLGMEDASPVFNPYYG